MLDLPGPLHHRNLLLGGLFIFLAGELYLAILSEAGHAVELHAAELAGELAIHIVTARRSDPEDAGAGHSDDFIQIPIEVR
ncbi:MAG: hypothetical protein GY910_18690 [bacterium]|nr:hypothetical protein [bacterium]